MAVAVLNGLLARLAVASRAWASSMIRRPIEKSEPGSGMLVFAISLAGLALAVTFWI
jgi:hypothetical protein